MQNYWVTSLDHFACVNTTAHTARMNANNIPTKSWPEAEPHWSEFRWDVFSNEPKWIHWILLPLLCLAECFLLWFGSSGHVTPTAVHFIKERTTAESNRVWILADGCLMSSCALSPSISSSIFSPTKETFESLKWCNLIKNYYFMTP